MEWKTGDWVVLDMRIGQITELREEGAASLSDGCIETSGRLVDRFRPLTLRNKSIVENFHAWYDQLREIDGQSGFNYPDISSYFSHLALCAMDADNDGARDFYAKAQHFLFEARRYAPTIDGVALFRPTLRRVGN